MKTFAEKLNEHIDYCERVMKQAGRVILLAREIKREGYAQNNTELIERAEKALDITGDALNSVEATYASFESEHSRELEDLKTLVENNK